MAFASICCVFGPVPLVIIWLLGGDAGWLSRLGQVIVGLVRAAAAWCVVLFLAGTLP